MALKKDAQHVEPKVDKKFILGHMEENEIDLSICNLSHVPVNELAMVPRGTKVDLSRNLLKVLPDRLGTLKHIIELDLSSNHITELPASIGNLILLQRLDLYTNQLTSLPLTFWQLRKLKWLDISNNKLEEGLEKAAGPCVSEDECRQCATKVILYMKQKSSNFERQQQLKLRMKREEEKRLLQEEILKQEAAKKQKAENLRRRKHSKQQEEERIKLAMLKEKLENAEFLKNELAVGEHMQASKARNTSFYRSLGRLLVKILAFVVLLFLLSLIVTSFYCNSLSDKGQMGQTCYVWRKVLKK